MHNKWNPDKIIPRQPVHNTDLKPIKYERFKNRCISSPRRTSLLFEKKFDMMLNYNK